MILWRKIEIIHFYHFDSDPRFPPFLLYVRWKSGVTFVRRCFRAVIVPVPGNCLPFTIFYQPTDLDNNNVKMETLLGGSTSMTTTRISAATAKAAGTVELEFTRQTNRGEAYKN